MIVLNLKLLVAVIYCTVLGNYFETIALQTTYYFTLEEVELHQSYLREKFCF